MTESSADPAPPARPRSGLMRLLSATVELPSDVLRMLDVPLFKTRRGPSPGAHPGELAISADAEPVRVRLFVYDADHCEERELSDPSELPDLNESGVVTWLDVEGLGDQRWIEALGAHHTIHPLALADVIHVPQRPKAEDYGDHTLVVCRMAQLRSDEGSGESEVEFEQVSFVLGAGWVVSFQERPGDVFEPLRMRLRAGTGQVRRMGADYLAYALIDAVVDGYFPVVEHLSELIQDLEEDVLTRGDGETLTRVHAVRRLLFGIERVQWRQRDLLASLLRDPESMFGENVQVYLRDVHDHAMQLLDVIVMHREIAAGLVDLYISRTNNRMSQVMQTLTVMASIFIPLTFLAGVYGMNFEYMPELRWRWGYPFAWGLMLLVGGGLLLWFRRRGWLRSG